MQPLQGMRVLDLTQVMAGPYCTQLLGDLGADVVKVEPPGGDQARGSLGVRRDGGDTAAFLAVNRNKRSIVLDLHAPGALDVFGRLVAHADVLVENFRPGVTGRLGIDYAAVRERNPRLVYASVSGFGQTGPYAARPGYDLVAQAMSGVLSVTGEPGGAPVKCGVPVADLGAALFATVGVLAACAARERTGAGQHVDVALLDSALALSVWETAELWATGHVPEPVGSAHRLSAPYQALRAADGWLTVAGNNQRLWERLCAVLGRDDLTADARFATNGDRLANRDALAAELESALAARPAAEWADALLAAGVPAGPIRRYDEVCADPHTAAREMVTGYDHPVAGHVRTLGLPVKLSGTPGAVRRPAPLLGEHTDEILAEHGYDDGAVAGLRSAGVVR